MRAPDNKQQPFVGYTDAQWDAIRESLGGIDLDTTMVNVKWPFDDLGVRSLRGLLQKLAWHSGETSPLGKALTPKQLAAKWQKELTKLRSAIDAVATFKFYDAPPPWLPVSDRTRARIATYDVVRSAMADIIAEWQQRIDMLTTTDSLSSANARKPHIRYWKVLTRVCLKVTGSVGPKRRQRLRRFLLACTPPDLFPETAQELEQKLDSFINNFFKSR
jgi:hypothetical protein